MKGEFLPHVLLILNSPIGFGIVLLVLAGIPLIALCATSFLRISIVLGVMRSAFGAPGIPSSAVSGVLAILLSICAMRPVTERTLNECNVGEIARVSALGKVQVSDIDRMESQFVQCLVPLRDFLLQHAGENELNYFRNRHMQEAAAIVTQPNLSPPNGSNAPELPSFVELVPAFVLSEIKRGCIAGFLFLLPFLVIDIVVSNLMLAVGMSMVSPVVFTFPIKLGIFVLADGWLQISKSLIESF